MLINECRGTSKVKGEREAYWRRLRQSKDGVIPIQNYLDAAKTHFHSDETQKRGTRVLLHIRSRMLYL
jgi:hypothetical protein